MSLSQGTSHTRAHWAFEREGERGRWAPLSARPVGPSSCYVNGERRRVLPPPQVCCDGCCCLSWSCSTTGRRAPPPPGIRKMLLSWSYESLSLSRAAISLVSGEEEEEEEESKPCVRYQPGKIFYPRNRDFGVLLLMLPSPCSAHTHTTKGLPLSGSARKHPGLTVEVFVVLVVLVPVAVLPDEPALLQIVSPKRERRSGMGWENSGVNKQKTLMLQRASFGGKAQHKRDGTTVHYCMGVPSEP